MSLQVIAAGYESRCTICEEEIAEGDAIVHLDDEWVHAACAEENGEDVDWGL